MACSPKFRKQRSCSYMAGCWGPRSGRRAGRFARRLDHDDNGYYYDDEEEFGMSAYDSSWQPGGSRWSLIWRRILKEKRRIFESDAPVHEPYDEHSYAQNFDEGATWVEPENLSRSFSARFAAQPRILRRAAS